MHSSLILRLFASSSLLLGEVASYEIPQRASDPASRQEAINATRTGFLYGPAVAGGPLYPTGPLGNAKVAADIACVTLPYNVYECSFL